MSVNLRQLGKMRDVAIVNTVEQLRVLTTEQIHCLFFDKISFGIKKAQERLRKLYQRKKLKRHRISIDEPYVYYIDRKPGNTDHFILANWTYIWMVKKLKNWEKVEVLAHEYNMEVLQTDVFMVVKNTATGKCKGYFIEVDRRADEFDKVQKYNLLYSSGIYSKCLFVDMVETFPEIIIVTTEHRIPHITEQILKHNHSDLTFKIYTERGIYDELGIHLN